MAAEGALHQFGNILLGGRGGMVRKFFVTRDLPSGWCLS